ncbi:hypothetical protein PVAP13_8KG173102 [Panicum virgatum]|uniref:Uncharacterized protein n=1 Tax=Panicum virgatum TaxID=38727 RepID=A0A8T0PVL7_PANVG|nr:hypothetical protein PVAP13_8KG173102 [Panicum virgatum]
MSTSPPPPPPPPPIPQFALPFFILFLEVGAYGLGIVDCVVLQGAEICDHPRLPALHRLRDLGHASRGVTGGGARACAAAPAASRRGVRRLSRGACCPPLHRGVIPSRESPSSPNPPPSLALLILMLLCLRVRGRNLVLGPHRAPRGRGVVATERKTAAKPVARRSVVLAPQVRLLNWHPRLLDLEHVPLLSGCAIERSKAAGHCLD